MIDFTGKQPVAVGDAGSGAAAAAVKTSCLHNKGNENPS